MKSLRTEGSTAKSPNGYFPNASTECNRYINVIGFTVLRVDKKLAFI